MPWLTTRRIASSIAAPMRARCGAKIDEGQGFAAISAISSRRSGAGLAIAAAGIGADEVGPKLDAGMAHPADARAGTPAISAKAGTSLVTTAPAAMKEYSPMRMAADDGGVGADGGAALDEGRAELVLALDLGTRVVHVGEHAGRPAEHALLERDALVEADVVLDLAGVADGDVGADHDVLPDGHVPPDLDAAEDVAEVPDRRAFADLDRLDRRRPIRGSCTPGKGFGTRPEGRAAMAGAGVSPRSFINASSRAPAP